jgi:hypothetical protein
MGDIAGIPRRAIILAIALLTAEALWVLRAAFAHRPNLLSLAVFAATAVPVLVAAIWRTGAAKVLGALGRSALAVGVGYAVGVPVIVVWIQHQAWATAWQDWSLATITILVFGIACLVLGRAVRAK